MDARVPADPIFAAFGVPAIVMRDDEDPIEATAVWVPEDTQNNRWGAADQSGVEIERVVPRKVICFQVSEVAAAPYGTRIVAPEELDGTLKQWRVDEIVRVENDIIRLIVAPMETSEYLEAWGK